MTTKSLIEFSATEMAAKICAGEVTSEELVQAHLERIEQIEDEVQAWTHLDPDYALGQARVLDDHRRTGGALGPLHGIPVGIKDIVNTESLPSAITRSKTSLARSSRCFSSNKFPKLYQPSV